MADLALKWCLNRWGSEGVRFSVVPSRLLLLATSKSVSYLLDIMVHGQLQFIFAARSFNDYVVNIINNIMNTMLMHGQMPGFACVQIHHWTAISRTPTLNVIRVKFHVAINADASIQHV